MRSSRIVLPTLFTLFALAAARPSDATSVVTIDFEAQANLEVLTNQFAADHILFGNVIVLRAFDTLNEIDFPPSSGLQAISGLDAGPAVIEFTRPATLFRVHLTTFETAAVTLFLDDGTSVTHLIASNLGVGEDLSFSAGRFDRIEIAGTLSGNAFALTLDDVEFAIPEPSAFLVMALGLVPISLAIRRHARV
jgi:hypothetical protein